MMKYANLQEINKKLEGLNYRIIAGFAITLYTSGKRKANDIDILLTKKDLNIFAQRLQCKPAIRTITKGIYRNSDYGFETTYKGQKIEATSGYPEARVKKRKMGKVFKHKKQITFQGIRWDVVPIEELIVLKASLQRTKDKKDIQILKKMKSNLKLLKEIAKDCNVYEKVIKIF